MSNASKSSLWALVTSFSLRFPLIHEIFSFFRVFITSVSNYTYYELNPR